MNIHSPCVIRRFFIVLPEIIGEPTVTPGNEDQFTRPVMIEPKGLFTVFIEDMLYAG